MFLSFPSTKDSEWSARFPGKSTAHIISEAPLEWFEEWRGDGFRVRKRGKDYEALKAELTKRLLVRNPLPTPCLRLRVATVSDQAEAEGELSLLCAGTAGSGADV